VISTGQLYFNSSLATASSRPIDNTMEKSVDRSIDQFILPSRVRAEWIAHQENTNDSRGKKRQDAIGIYQLELTREFGLVNDHTIV
jgi:hypothetical protein